VPATKPYHVAVAMLLVAALLLVVPGVDAKLDRPAARAAAYLQEHAAASGSLAPNVAEAAYALGHHPARWPEGDPIAARVEVPAGTASNVSLLRPLRALALAQDDRADADGELTQRVQSHLGTTGYGDTRTLNDDAYAILALRATDPGAGNDRFASLRQHLIANQHADGGWGWAVDAPSGTDITGLVLEGLFWSGGIDGIDRNGTLAFLARTHHSDGGFAESLGGQRNCESTVWGIRAQQRLQADVDPDDWVFLLGLQQDDGGFSHLAGGKSDLLCTTEAAAFLGENLVPATKSDGIPAPSMAWTLLALVIYAVSRSTRLRQP
jgi:hypothetical protein